VSGASIQRTPASSRCARRASTPGSGLPIEPGFTSIAGVLAIMMPPVSVCHQLSWIGMPKASMPHHTASGLSGSPTLAMNLSFSNECFFARSNPAFISMRIAVGAVYQTVTCCSRRMRYQRSASNSASSTMLVTPCTSGATMP
jgi:hypothetical protein